MPGTPTSKCSFSSLEYIGIVEDVIEHLANYASKEGFDTEAMDWDFLIDDGGNIQHQITNLECINFIKEVFQEATSMLL